MYSQIIVDTTQLKNLMRTWTQLDTELTGMGKIRQNRSSFIIPYHPILSRTGAYQVTGPEVGDAMTEAKQAFQAVANLSRTPQSSGWDPTA